MKAKEYAERYRTAASPNNELVQIARDFILEIETIARARKAQKDMAVVRIVREQEKKWKAFCKQTRDPNIKEDGFMSLLKAQCPELCDAVLAAEMQHEEMTQWKREARDHRHRRL